MTIRTQTLLDAINSLLTFVGIATLNTLDEATDPDSAKAIKALGDVSRSIQSTGWECNKESNYTLRRDDETLKFAVPASWLAVDASGGENVVLRGGYLYDKTAHSFQFSDKQELNVDIIVQLELNELPTSLREYIIIKAKRRFQREILGDASLDRLAETEEREAYELLHGDELEQGDHNLLSDSLTQAIQGRSSNGLT